MKKRLRDTSLKIKISGMTLIIAVVPLLIFSIVMAVRYNAATEARSTLQLEENLEVMSDRIERVFSDAKLCSNYLTLTLNRIYKEKNFKPIERDNNIFSTLNQTVLIFEGIDSLVFITTDGKMYSTNYTLYAKQEQIEASEYMQKLQAKKNGTTLLFNTVSDCMERDGGHRVITLGKRIVNINLGETFGFLFVNLDSAVMEETVKNEISSYYLYDLEDNCVTGKREPDFAKEVLVERTDSTKGETKSVKAQDGKYLVAWKNIDEFKWTLLGVTDLGAYNVVTTQMIGILILSSVVTAVLIIALGLWLTNRLTKPLTKLTQGALEIADGNLDVQLDLGTADEIGQLGTIFEDMTVRIKQLLADYDAEARKKREYELALVQEQVKPHFLYNTLDIIMVLIEMGKSREAERVTKKLADYYKNSLSSSEEIIPLEREVRIIEDYLDLQLMRYKDKFRFNISVEPEIAAVMVPKMTLQPLVENAIYHGIKNKEGSGLIDVSAVSEGESVVITVSDDGVGMDEDELGRMLELKALARNHFGVYSVNRRLQLYYSGTDYQFEVESEKGVGTKIRITIPASSDAE